MRKVIWLASLLALCTPSSVFASMIGYLHIGQETIKCETLVDNQSMLMTTYGSAYLNNKSNIKAKLTFEINIDGQVLKLSQLKKKQYRLKALVNNNDLVTVEHDLTKRIQFEEAQFELQTNDFLDTTSITFYVQDDQRKTIAVFMFHLEIVAKSNALVPHGGGSGGNNLHNYHLYKTAIECLAPTLWLMQQKAFFNKETIPNKKHQYFYSTKTAHYEKIKPNTPDHTDHSFYGACLHDCHPE
ncbi:MAG: hypothetical protein MRY78_00690 [Saprospiraceae bacterium]|nr:hypothetical protein [Saprospiraceae bacterium]